jgi:hypothetical protein
MLSASLPNYYGESIMHVLRNVSSWSAIWKNGPGKLAPCFFADSIDGLPVIRPQSKLNRHRCLHLQSRVATESPQQAVAPLLSGKLRIASERRPSGSGKTKSNATGHTGQRCMSRGSKGIADFLAARVRSRLESEPQSSIRENRTLSQQMDALLNPDSGLIQH